MVFTKAGIIATTSWLRAQCANPGDIFTILLIIGGDIVRQAIAQLSGGHLVPVSFSFGWVAYAVSAVMSAVGENRLMPNPDFPCTVININSGYARQNFSWLLARMLRDFDHWKDPQIGQAEENKLRELAQVNSEVRKKFERGHLSIDKDPCIRLRISIYEAVNISGQPSVDWLYLLGLATIVVQHGVAVIPLVLHGEWLTLFATVVGTLLAVTSASLSQWREEKFGYFRLDGERKDIALTQGNGCLDVLVILGNGHGLDIEWMASPNRRLSSSTRLISFCLAVGWIMLLVCVAGWQNHTWYILGVGILGIMQNITVAGWWRHPRAYGFNMQFREIFVDWRVMSTLAAAETRYPRLGQSLLPIFFPGELWPREKAFWSYAERRALAYGEAARSYAEGIRTGKTPSPPSMWEMPPLRVAAGMPAAFDADIPEQGPYVPASTEPGKGAQVKVEAEREISIDFPLPLIGRTVQN